MLFLLFPYFIIISQYSRVYPLNCIALCTYSCFIALVIADKCRGGGRNHPLAWRLIEGDGIYLYKGGTQGASNTGREPPAANKNPLAAR